MHPLAQKLSQVSKGLDRTSLPYAGPLARALARYVLATVGEDVEQVLLEGERRFRCFRHVYRLRLSNDDTAWMAELVTTDGHVVPHVVKFGGVQPDSVSAGAAYCTPVLLLPCRQSENVREALQLPYSDWISTSPLVDLDWLDEQYWEWIDDHLLDLVPDHTDAGQFPEDMPEQPTWETVSKKQRGTIEREARKVQVLRKLHALGVSRSRS